MSDAMDPDAESPLTVALRWGHNKAEAKKLTDQIGKDRTALIEASGGNATEGGDDFEIGPAKIVWRENKATDPVMDGNKVVAALMELHSCEDLAGLCAEFGLNANDYMIPGKERSYTPVATVRKLTAAEKGLYAQSEEPF